jgi:hypothetical protein
LQSRVIKVHLRRRSRDELIDLRHTQPMQHVGEQLVQPSVVSACHLLLLIVESIDRVAVHLPGDIRIRQGSSGFVRCNRGHSESRPSRRGPHLACEVHEELRISQGSLGFVKAVKARPHLACVVHEELGDLSEGVALRAVVHDQAGAAGLRRAHALNGRHVEASALKMSESADSSWRRTTSGLLT